MTRTISHHSDSPPTTPRRASGVVRAGIALGVVFAAAAGMTGTVDAERTASTTDVTEILTDVEEILTPTEIEEILEDETIELDDGGLLVTDPAPLGPFPTESDHTGPASTSGDDEPQSAGPDVFSLHTRPGASRKIFLDFDGHVTQNTPWNSATNVDTIVSGIYSRESKGARNGSFSEVEIDGIVEIWERVAEDFAAWDVDVTTEDPGVAGLRVDSPVDTRHGIRVVISQDSEWFGDQPAGGVAYLFSFTNTDGRPAFVFSSNLADGRPKSVAEAVSHEVGHSLGLRHDGVQDNAGNTTGHYYAGHDVWAPIMGVGYGRPVTQWSKGEYAGANNGEDDLALIDEFLPRLPDLSSSSTLGGGDSETVHTITRGGAIARHPLNVIGGPVTVRVSKPNQDGNLLADLVIRDPNGDVVAGDAPTDANSWDLTASLPVDVTSGTYSVEVRSIGWQTPSTGFSSYASIGDYVIDVRAPDSGTTTTPTTTTPTTTPGTTTPPTTSTGTGGAISPPGNDTSTRPPDTGESGDRLTAISPRRVVDSRRPGAPLTRIERGSDVRLTIDDAPGDASAAVINVVAVNPSGTGFLSITPCNPVADADRTSSLNFVAGKNVGNSVIAPLSDAGELCVYSSTSTDVVIDLTGWIGPDGRTALADIGSERVVDTRRGDGIDRSLVAGQRAVVPLVALGDGSPIEAVAVNLTAINPSAAGFLTVDDCSSASTGTSSLNFDRGETRGNNGIFSLSRALELCVTSSVDTHLTLDVTGTFGYETGLTFVPTEPGRVLDTRGSGRIGAGASTGFDVPAAILRDGTRVTPAAASVNIAATGHTTGGYVTAWDCGPRPRTSALNPIAGAATANSALVTIASTARSCLYHADGGHLVVDLNGWWV